MAAGVDEPEPVVPDATVHFVVTARLARLACEQGRDLTELGRPYLVVPDPVNGTVARGRDEPRTRLAGHAVAAPGGQRQRERLLRRFLGQIPVAGQADPRGDDPTPLRPDRLGDGGLHAPLMLA